MCKKLFAGLFLLSTATVTWAQNSEEDTREKQTSKRPSWSAGLPERTKGTGINKPEFKSEVDKVELDMSEFGLKTKPEVEIDLPIKPEMPLLPATSSITENQATRSEPEAVAVTEATLPAEETVSDASNLETGVESQIISEEPIADEIITEETVVETPIAESISIDQEGGESVQEISVVENEANATAIEPSSDNTSELAPETVTFPVEQGVVAVERPVSNRPVDVSEAATEEMTYNWNILERAEVKYPIKAIKDKLEGWVDVKVTIDSTGKVVSADAIDHSRRGRVFGQPAIQSVKKWLFTPPSEYGVNTNISKVYKIEFDL